MRWRRTERNLMAALGKALGERRLDKISVTAVAEAADISKATFYLHYRDIYDAAEAYAYATARELTDSIDYLQDYFDNPRRFAERFVDTMDGSHGRVEPLMVNGLGPIFLGGLVDAMAKAFEAIRPIDGDGREKIALTFVLHGLLGAAAPGTQVSREDVKLVAGGLLEDVVVRGRYRGEHGWSRDGEM